MAKSISDIFKGVPKLFTGPKFEIYKKDGCLIIVLHGFSRTTHSQAGLSKIVNEELKDDDV